MDSLTLVLREWALPREEESLSLTLNSCTCSTQMSEYLLVSRAKLWRQYLNKKVSTLQGSLIQLGVNRWLGYSVVCSRQASRRVVLKLRRKGKSARARQRSGWPQQQRQPEQYPGGSDQAALASRRHWPPLGCWSLPCGFLSLQDPMFLFTCSSGNWGLPLKYTLVVLRFKFQMGSL